MKNLLFKLGVLAALTSLNGYAWAQPPQLPEPLVAQDFENETPTWLGMGDSAKVSTERIPENVKVGAGALRFNYNIAPGQNNILASSIALRSLSTLQSISFWIKVNHNTSLVFALQEQGGGRFGTVFSVAKDEWQRVEIAPSEMVLQTGRSDPKDDNGQLDLENVEYAALFDFNQIFAQVATDPQTPLGRLLGVEMGPRALYLDDLVFSSKPLSPAPPEKSVLDAFERPQAAWLSVGNATLKTVKDEKQENNSLQMDYNQAPGRIVAVGKLLTKGALDKKSALSFNIASKKNLTLVVQLEETSGGKYNAVFIVPSNTTPTLKTLPFADFKPADDSKDDNNQLDLTQVKQILMIDASGMLGMGEGDNTLWLSQLRVK